MINVSLVSYTQPVISIPAATPEELVMYCAKVSNPSKQGDFSGGLLEYCIRNSHWSIFEMVDATLEIKSPRDITRQIIRHRSFFFQEFSQRYSDEISFCDREMRLQDKTNRQNSVGVEYDSEHRWLIDNWQSSVDQVVAVAEENYRKAIANGVAKEVARTILPEGLTMSTIYMKGSLRSWMHYLDVREGNGTQKEHIMVANKCREVLTPVFPRILGVSA